MAQEFHLRNPKDTFLGIYDQAMLPEPLKKLV
jgi:hypothetical protein